MGSLSLMSVVLGAVLVVSGTLTFFADSPWRQGGHAVLDRLVWRAAALLGALLAHHADHEPAALVLGGLAGAAGAFTLSGLGAIPTEASTRLRSGSLLAKVETRRLLARALLCAVGMAGIGRFAGLGGVFGAVPSWVDRAVLLVATALLMLIWSKGASTTRRLAQQAERARPYEDPLASVVSITDLGEGDERWVAGVYARAPYRGGMAASELLIGSVTRTLRKLTAVVVGDALKVMVALSMLLLSFWPVGPAPSTKSMSGDEWLEPTTPTPMKTSTERRTYLSWYPMQDGPILDDLNGDGVEDVIGLRWDPSHEAAALQVIASDGVTMQPRWSTQPIPSQWSNGSIHLVKSGEALFLTDSEGQVHVYGVRDGLQRFSKSVPVADVVCAAPDGSPRIYIETHWKNEGIELGADGKQIDMKRPTWCEPDTCPARDGSACRPVGERPAWFYEKARAGTFLEQGNIGMAVAPSEEVISVAKNTKPGDDATAPLLFAYDARSRKRLYQTTLPFSSDALHRNPHLELALESGRLFSYYQLRSGQWMLGARDAKTGDVLWHEAPPRSDHGTSFRSMTASQHRLYVALDSRLEVFEAPSGKSLGVIW